MGRVITHLEIETGRIKLSTVKKGGVTKKLLCPGYASAAETFLKAGKFERTRKTRGDSLSACPART